jgi:translation initiation factor 1
MGKLVYSTDPGPTPMPTPPTAEKPVKQQTATVARDRKRRKGKTVTVISGLHHNPEALRELLKNLQKALGAGGTVKEGEKGPEIEIQGDHRERAGALLIELGYKVKYSGG